MKTSELTGKQLDHWVAKAQGWELKTLTFNHPCGETIEDFWVGDDLCILAKSYTPSTNGGQCFELMQLPSFKWSQPCDARVATGDTFVAKFEGCKFPFNYGPTPLVATCRAFVASVYGEEVHE